MVESLITAEPLGLPVPPTWLFGLKIFGFLLHMVFMNLWLAGLPAVFQLGMHQLDQGGQARGPTGRQVVVDGRPSALPPPMTPDEEALRKLMLQIQPALGDLRKGVEAAAAAPMGRASGSARR